MNYALDEVKIYFRVPFFIYFLGKDPRSGKLRFFTKEFFSNIGRYYWKAI